MPFITATTTTTTNSLYFKYMQSIYRYTHTYVKKTKAMK